MTASDPQVFQEFAIWMEGYIVGKTGKTAGIVNPAQCLGFVYARSFHEACNKFFCYFDNDHYDSAKRTYRGIPLYDQETLARRRHG